MSGAGNFTTGTNPDAGGVVVPADSDIQTAADLAGHTIAVNTLNNIGDITVREAVEKAGGDPSSINFVEMGFPDMPAAVTGGQVDAAWVVEPHLTRVIEAGARVVSWNWAETDPNLIISTYFTSQQYAEANPEIVASFKAALDKALTHAAENPEAAKDILDNYTDIDATIKEKMTMPKFTPEVSAADIQLHADLALKYGLVKEPVDISVLVP
ncbi:ABC transporter substrate-binding protein [Gulosibacter macacae]|uniref:ABC transporter substrate-binding protein n=1 Tax=Gulosibacter macacae TaxID=2488791 RepID=UPI002286E486|nr:ABC transporter substrate-binding protein [Gulosibacter macacae]